MSHIINNIKKIIGILCFITITFLFVNVNFAASYTLCKGSDFNRRIKLLLSGENYSDEDNKITSFQRGTNPPADNEKFTDVSEDRDGTIIVYRVNNVLYYYTDNAVFMNEDSSHMFEKFRNIRTIDISQWIYNYVRDTRYMFASCHKLTTIKLKKLSNEKNVVKPIFELVEMQGMYYDCQSLMDIHLELIDTRRVENMTEVFARCNNVKNIYVDKDRWNISNCRYFNKMFEGCYLLKTNRGRKIVDISEEMYETLAIPGTDYIEGVLKDINTTYADYGEHDGKAPIDDKGNALKIQETTVTYLEEPEEDGNGELGEGSGNGIGTSNGKPYVGDKGTGYGAEKETTEKPNIIIPTTSPFTPIETTQMTETELQIPETYIESSKSIETKISEETNTIESYIESSKQVESEENVESTIGIETEKNQKVMELEEYLKEKTGGDGNIGGGESGNEQEERIARFYGLALLLSALAILLLVGMVIFLARDNRDNNENNKKNKKQ